LVSRSKSRGCIAVAAMALFALLSSCGGGGGNDCEITGDHPDVYFTPSVPVTGNVAQDALTYRLSQRNTWTVQPRRMTQACLQGLKVELRDPQFPLPAGFTLDEKTGTIDSGLMTRHMEGSCTRVVNSSTESGPDSVNRVCPTGYTLQDHYYVVVVTSDRFNQTTRIPTALIFRPVQ
jgi:hypothetical protein